MTLRRTSGAATCEPTAVGHDSPPARLDLRRLSHHCEQIPRTAHNELEATHRLVQLTRELTHGVAVLYFGLDSTHQLAVDPCSRSPDQVGEHLLNQLYLLARRSQDTEVAQLVQMPGESPQIAAAVPVPRRDGKVEVLVVLMGFSGEDRRQVAGVVQVAQLLAAFAGQWRGCFDQVHVSARADLFEQLVRAAGAANRAQRWTSACEDFANCLADHWGAQLVVIGQRRRGDMCRVAGMSHGFPPSPGAPLVAAIEAVMAEGLARKDHEPLEQLSSGELGTESTAQLQSLLNSQGIYRSLLCDGAADVLGACLIIRDCPFSSAEQVGLRESCQFIGPHLARLKQTRLSWWQRGRNAFKQLAPMTRRTIIVATGAAALLLFALPLPYHVKCRCDVQPVTRRFVGAPYEGRLQDALVEPGDLVRAGQTLAIMDGREVRLELSGREAELQRVTKQRDRALANRETAAAQIALLEMQRLQTEMQLYQDRLENLEIRSPTDGVVISGDPQKLEGARLTIGQTLLEVGPLGEMVLEVAIPDERIAHVTNLAAVRFRLDAMPRTSFQGRLARIHPRSELRDAQNVFIGEVQIAKDAGLLRPGMRGYAKLSAGRRSLFWSLFHRAIDHLLFQIGW
jgi:hypothetical protein